ncbi:MAG TPA: ABC transporter permease [Bacteroidetes bacterium]|nr:ABC transporter permease [Bacteroidota bacterium]
MRTILFLLQKEFLQIFRNRLMLPVIFVLPLVQMLILVHAATLEMKKIDLVVVDRDLSSWSGRLAQKFMASPFFRVHDGGNSREDAQELLRKGKADMVMVIPAGFERNMMREGEESVQWLVDAINGTAAGLSHAYASAILAGFHREWLQETGNTAGMDIHSGIKVQERYWYNPKLNYKIFMIPGIMVLLVTIIGMFLSALNLVREKELGTIEQINVTPIRKYQFITGKLIPFWVIALFDLSVGLSLGYFLFDMPVLGSLPVLFAFTSLYLVVIMGLGLFISTMVSNQQQVMFMGFFFIIVFILMSGIFTSTETMPAWAQTVNIINPLAYFMRVIRMIVLKGSGLADIGREMILIGIYAVLAMSLAVWRYRKVA